ncbi:threonine synthase [Gluconobacter wancherniae]|uniref:Threonine synthase n=1 Tax=Gluconobacter wancherniae NBRC 103581 TaxID=656744 RepID=A0A511AX82_9PROT|nr:threonine synthase [Gluconobacter wancherniae]MBF0852929.1 threonine synthase [Gluconobacter wancherniae]MBS1061726.1 threonine synthase [Gluconobacter wancherniae]GBD56354.1 threonine synthase [Gluconobacter wancherniae NBRC 103581]GBR63709.1 threonine synthase [Gluconobacter wancherniae NBRC 103581]GEK92746.1 threonine synthase [Gluconobacter wancherniae NBRC 103581]
MRYRSTRGELTANAPNFSDILLAGLAGDGGLYMPETWPKISAQTLREWRSLSYPDLAAEVMAPFTAGAIDRDTLRGMCRDAYAGFDHAAVAPLCEVEEGLFALELFHGPTLAFKDMAMQLLGRLFDHVLTERNRHVTIVGATSGDTGSAAIEACRGRDRLSVVILHPKGRTSDVQRRQMTTILDENILNIAVEGDFDTCQDLVKGMFADKEFRDEVSLSAVNSINWARIAAQIPYYVRAALALGAPDREVSFAVPTGNFGNVLAAWAARQMGLPIKRLCVGSNRNDILTRFLLDNDMSMRAVEPSLSPSMDIQVSSNFERLLFEMLDRNPTRCAAIMREFRETGRMAVPHDAWTRMKEVFDGMTLDDTQTSVAMREFYSESLYLADPHTAIGLAAGKRFKEAGIPMVAAATAHPAKFPDAVFAATGIRAELPPHLADLFEREERYTTMSSEISGLQAAVRAHIRRN